MKLKLLLSLALFVTISSAHGQYFSFDDILKVYSLDSTSLKQFCAEKRYKLNKVTKTNYIVSYSYQSLDKKSVSFTRTFPNDTAGNRFVYYYFNNAKEFRQLKASAKSAGFAFLKKYAMPTKYADMQSERERYIKDGLELEFGISNVGPGRYVVMLYTQVNF